MGPFHVLRGSLVLYKFFAVTGVVLYFKLPQLGPPHGLSHAHLPPSHWPLSEQSRAEVQLVDWAMDVADNSTKISTVAVGGPIGVQSPR